MKYQCLRCAKYKHMRGLCASCYGTAARFIREGRFTWNDLEKRGFAEPLKKVGPRPYSITDFCKRKEQT